MIWLIFKEAFIKEKKVFVCVCACVRVCVGGGIILHDFF